MKIRRRLTGNMLELPAIGQGVGEYAWDSSHADIIRQGIGLGMNFIDTAESYDNGSAEELVGTAIKGIRDKVILGTKFAPQHNSYKDVISALEASLGRLDTDYIDLYQLHWPNPAVPLNQTMAAMERLVSEGKVRYIGVGNLYLNEFTQASSVLASERLSSIQLEYNLFDRMVEEDILPYCRLNGMFLIAYSPLDRGRVVEGEARKKLILEMSQKYNKTAAQICLRWLINNPNVITIPKASNIRHLKENSEAADFDIEEGDLQKIAKVFFRPVVRIEPDRIRVSTSGQDSRLVYRTLEEAMENKLGHVPSPLELSKSIVKEDKIKPVRLVKIKGGSDKYDYDLVEGRIRYWAWVIARGNLPIPSYIREGWD